MPIDRFDKEKFDKALYNFKDGWTEKLEYDEWRYRLPFGEHGVIFINSSIGSDGFAKSTGKDSIRVWVEYDGKHMKKSQRWTTRMPGWEDRLRERISEACKLIKDMDYSPKCPVCGGSMVLRKGVYGKFYGCLKYPMCRGTRQYEEDVAEEISWVKN